MILYKKSKKVLDKINTLTSQYNWHSDDSMRWTLNKISQELKELQGENNE